MVLSLRPYTRVWPGADVVVLQGRALFSAEAYQRAWFDAVRLVKTSHFLFLDDDDELQLPLPAFVQAQARHNFDLLLMDEAWINPDGTSSIKRGAPYTQEAHLSDIMLVHHSVFRTDAVLAALDRLPRGHFWPEMMVGWEVAKAGRARYVAATGYRWNRRPSGLHTAPWMTTSQVRTALWCGENR